VSGYDDWIGRSIPDSVMEDAASWMALLDSDDCTTAQRASFAQWLSEDPIHQGAFEELSAVWAKLHMLTDVQSLKQHPDVIPFPATAEAHLFEDEVYSTSSGWSTLAASLLVIVGVLAHGLFGVSPDRHDTRLGEHDTISLADGSVVELGSESTILVRIDETSREVRLTDGKAVFDVRKDERPFTVVTDLATMTAIGTQFSASTGPLGIEIFVIQGVLSVTPTRDDFSLTEYHSDLQKRTSADVTLLAAGQSLVLSAVSSRYQLLTKSGATNKSLWSERELASRE
jgi:transmembrane sensor